MDDAKTQRELDTLAELFLTGYAVSRSGTDSHGLRVDQPPKARPEAARPPRPMVPVRLPPKPVAGKAQASQPAPTPTPPRSSPSRSAIADLMEDGPDIAGIIRPKRVPEAYRQGGHALPRQRPGLPPAESSGLPSMPRPDGFDAAARPASHRRPRPLTPTRVEAVFVGSLPGFGGPWLTQYAHHQAVQHGPVALLHLNDAWIDVELVTPHLGSDQPAPPPIPVARPTAPNSHEALPKLRNMIQSLGPLAAVVLHLDEPTSAIAMNQALAVPNWTLLCGGYDAAVVDAFRLLKQISEAQPQALRQHSVSVMVMGSDEDRAQAAARKLNAAAGAMLHREIQLAGCLKQMVPVNLKAVGSIAAGEADWPAVLDYLAGLAVTPAAAPSLMGLDDEIPELEDMPQEPLRLPSSNLAASLLRDEADDQEEADDQAREEADDQALPCESNRGASLTGMILPHHATPEAAESPAVAASAEAIRAALLDDPPTRGQDAAATKIRHQPAPKPTHSAKSEIRNPKSEIPSPDPDLAQFLTSIGGIVLAARCPRHPRTQILLDQDGRMHLLRRHQAPEGDKASVETGDLRSAIVDLLEARAWVREHAELLAMTQRQCRMDLAAEPTLHLFTNQAAVAASLVHSLGAVLKLHLLQEVRLADMATWYSAELN
ncbi:MAG: hypothetical protein WD042_07570 [Phycisphaeraceae bacterium]